ncbi:MAG: SDR family oxidoreductase [Rhodothalassiaceae bacterium]
MPCVLVTGANRGIGLEYVRQYAADGWQVIAGVRDPAGSDLCELESIAHGATSDVAIEALDVADDASVAALGARYRDHAIDVLINNAGLLTPDRGPSGTLQGLDAIDFDHWTQAFRVNTQGAMRVSLACLEALARSRRRTIVNMSSGMGSISRTSEGGAYYYRTSKAALNMLTRTLANDLAPRGITVIALDPGWVRTRMGGAAAPTPVADSVHGLRRVIDAAGPALSGRFFNRMGEEVPW